MANSSSLICFSLGFLILFHCGFAQIEQVVFRSQQQQQHGGQQQPRFQSQCQIQNLDALEPQQRVESEAGLTEFWDPNNEQLRCANVAVLRHTIQRRGLVVPSYTNAPQLIYVVEGHGVHGAVFPGCPETFQSEQSESQFERRREERGEREGREERRREERGEREGREERRRESEEREERRREREERREREGRGSEEERRADQHQKVRSIRKGDVIAVPQGVTHWIYNDGESRLVLVALVDVGNNNNQLDQNLRKFFLAGSPQEEFQAGGGRSQGRSQRGRGQEQRGNNIFSGLDENIVAESLNIDPELARRIQREEKNRGIIVDVREELEFLQPQSRQEEQEREREERYRRGRGGSSDNGLEESICTLRIKQNINDPSRADVFNPRGGRVTTVSSLDLPILNYVQLSAQQVVLYRNAVTSPHWDMNAHSISYVTRGSGRVQIVSESGDTVFDNEVREGQLFIVPQNFVAVRRAGNEGLEWVSFKTNSIPKTNQLAGKLSVLRGLPEDVIVNSFGISREEARRLKYNRVETSVFSPSRRSQRGRESERERGRERD